MKEFKAFATINATPEKIWVILTDAARYPEWDPNTIRIEGRIASGEKLVAYTKLNPKRAFPATVTEFVPSQRMTWSGGMPLRLFNGVRTFDLVPNANREVRFTLREQFSGPLLPLISRTLPDMNDAFQRFCAGLKERAERG